VRRVAEGLNTAVAQGALTRTEAVDLLVDQTDVRALLADVGVALGSDVQAPVLQAAQKYRALTATGAATMVVVVIAIAVLGFALAFRMTHPAFRARNTVEAGVKALLMIAASLAILTTVGIV
jgi:phosphate transport system permease protein